MSEVKWFAVRKPSAGNIIAISANQIVPPKFRGPTKMLYYIHQTPLSSCSVEGGSGDKTSVVTATHTHTICYKMAFDLHPIICTWDVVTNCIPVSFLSTWGVVIFEKKKEKEISIICP